jgi:hypothetical protein
VCIIRYFSAGDAAYVWSHTLLSAPPGLQVSHLFFFCHTTFSASSPHLRCHTPRYARHLSHISADALGHPLYFCGCPSGCPRASADLSHISADALGHPHQKRASALLVGPPRVCVSIRTYSAVRQYLYFCTSKASKLSTCRTILVDPPRAGLDAASLELTQKYDEIVYISCNPAKLRAELGARFTCFTDTKVQILTQTHAVDSELQKAAGFRV